MMVILLMAFVLVSFSFASFERFRVDFPQCTLVYAPSSQTLQISVSGRVLSYGQNWTVRQVYPYLYHLKLNTWSGFYWMVNTSRKEIYRVTGGTFGSVGGSQTQLSVAVDTVGGSGGGVPDRFSLQFSDAYLIYTRASQGIQIAASGTVLSYGQDWQKTEVYPYLIHIRQNNWSGFFWWVNTSRKEIHLQQGGTFGSVVGGTHTLLDYPVTVFGEQQQQAQTYTLSLSAMAGGSVTGGGQYAAGAVVNLQATPNAGYQFANWRRGSLVLSNQAHFAYTMPAEDVSLSAYFTQSMLPVGYALTLQSDPVAGGSVSGDGNYFAGSTINIQAVPNAGFQFIHWKRGSTIVSNQANFAYQMPSENVVLTAYFSQSVQPLAYTLDLQLNPPTGGTVFGSGSYPPGAWVTIQASVNAGYQFTGWTKTDAFSGWPGVPYSSQTGFGFSMPAENLTLVANFGQQAVYGQPTLGIHIEDHPFGVIVTNVLSGYPAFGKIQIGDILTHIQFLPQGPVSSLGFGMVSIGTNAVSVNVPSGTPIQNTLQLQTMLASMPPGQAIAIWMRRGGVYRLFVALNLGTLFPAAYLF